MSASRKVLALTFTVAFVVSGCFGGGTKAPTGGTSLTGTLRNEYGHPVGRATLKVGGVTATTGSDGAFRLSGIQSGSQTVVFRAKGYLDRDLTVTIKAGQANRLTEPGSGGPVILKTVHSATGSLAGLGVATPATAAKATKAPQSMKGAQSMQVAQTIQAMEAHTAACDTCHSVTDGVGTKFLDANSQSLCTQSGCHATAAEGGTFEHPAAHLDNTLIQPTGELAEYDQIGCLGCHVSHAETPGGSLTPGLPATVTNTSYTAYCTSCHNGSQPGNTFDPATHYGTDCTTSCHELSGVANGHKSCNRQGTGCHALSSTLALSPTHRLGTTPCANCHDTEGGPSDDYLLKATGDQLCVSACHNTSHDLIESELASAESHGADSAMYRHNLPCRTCHNVHNMGTGTVTDPFTKQAFPYEWVTSGAYCLLCHGLGNGYAAAVDLEAGLPATVQWPGAINIMPEFYAFRTRVTTFWIGNRYEAEGGINGPWYEAGLNGHYAHWGDEYVTNAPPGWPYANGYGDPSLPDPCIMCHGVHASADPKLVRPLSGPNSDWTMYRTDHQYDCHYSCHAPLGLAGGTQAASDHSVHSIEEAQAKTTTLPYAVLLP